MNPNPILKFYKDKIEEKDNVGKYIFCDSNEDKRNIFVIFDEMIKKYIKKRRISTKEIFLETYAYISKQSYSNYKRNYKKIKKRLKDIIIKLAFALECSLEEMEKLLNFAGYALADNDNRDKIIKDCFENRIEKKIFNILKINTGFIANFEENEKINNKFNYGFISAWDGGTFTNAMITPEVGDPYPNTI